VIGLRYILCIFQHFLKGGGLFFGHGVLYFVAVAICPPRRALVMTVSCYGALAIFVGVINIYHFACKIRTPDMHASANPLIFSGRFHCWVL